MRNNLKRILSLMLVVLCVTSFSVTAFASGGDEVATTPDTETTVTDETEAPAEDTAEDVEIPYSYTIDNDGNLVITVGGVADPAEVTTIGTVTTNGGRLNLRTGAGMDYEVIDQLRSGEEVTVIGTEGDWYDVIVPEKRLDNSVIAQALRSADALLQVIYSGKFVNYTKIIEDAENI